MLVEESIFQWKTTAIYTVQFLYNENFVMMGVLKGCEKSIFAGNGPLKSEHLRIMNGAHIIEVVLYIGIWNYCLPNF